MAFMPTEAPAAFRHRATIHVTMVDVVFAQSVNLPPPPAVVLDVTAKINQGTPSATVVTPRFSTTAPHELLLAFVAADHYSSGTNTNVTKVTCAGLSWTLVKRTNAQAGTAEIWRAFASMPLSQVNVAATLSQSVTSSMTVMTFKGIDTTSIDGSAAIGASGTSNAGSGAPTARLITTRNDSWVVGCSVKKARSQRDVCAEPGGEVYKSKIARFVKSGDETISRFGVGGDAGAVNGKKGVGRGEGRPLVTVDERMVLREAFPQGGRFLDQVRIIAGLRPVEGGFEQAGIADTGRSAVALDLVVMDSERFGERQIILIQRASCRGCQIFHGWRDTRP